MNFLNDIVSIVIAFVGLIFFIIGLQEKLKFRSEAYIKRYQLLYAPMSALLDEVCLESAGGILYPYFSMRWRNAKRFFSQWKIGLGIYALFDKGILKEKAETVYNTYLPMEEIKKILSENMAYADKKLIELVRAASSSRIEEPDLEEEYLTDDELTLFRYIKQRFDKLNRELVS